MRFPHIHIAGIMLVVALVALDLRAFRAFESGLDELLLFDVLPTANILILVGIAGLRSPRLRAFAFGYVAACLSSLVAYVAWSRMNPWDFLRYFNPPFHAVERRVEAVSTDAAPAIMYGLTILALAAPHVVFGLSGGFLTMKGWAIMGRRPDVARGGRPRSMRPGARPKD